MDDKFFFDWYQDRLVYMIYEGDDLQYLFSRYTGFREYPKEWRQNCLDFAYRTLTCNVCEICETNPDNLAILTELAQNDPSIFDGYAIWKSYIFDLTKEGESFLLSCGVDEDTEEFSPLLKEKLSALFDAHGVGFDKNCFIPVVD